MTREDVDREEEIGVTARDPERIELEDSGESLEAALAAIGRFELAPPPRILITGSLYLAGAVLNANGTVPV
jgi:folylpolyglutamate synthase/dihydropteroate synthase